MNTARPNNLRRESRVWLCGLVGILILRNIFGGESFFFGGPIEGVYHRVAWVVTLTMLQDVGSDYVLFKNGDAWQNPKLPLGSIDIARAKREHPQDWGRWRRAGSKIYLTTQESNTEEEAVLSLSRQASVSREPGIPT